MQLDYSNAPYGENRDRYKDFPRTKGHAELASQPVVLIPAYKPSDVLPDLAHDLLSSNAIQAVIVVNDGSPSESEALFEKLRQIKRVHVLDHGENQGKGAALKTGLEFAARFFPESLGVVTADADGQHAAEDVAKVARELQNQPGDIILGCRSFNGVVPLRSRFGNQMTKYVLQAFSGQKITDTQTGLRGIPADLIPVFSHLRPNGYDYELEMLLMSKNLGRQVREVGISTIYIDGNKSSHFNPLLDSLRIYAVFFRFAAASILSAILDNVLFMTIFALSGNIFASQCFGRVSSLLFNYFTNRNAVFHSRAKVLSSIPRYICLAVVLMTSSYFMIQLAVSLWSMNVIVAKIGAETLLFLLSFVAQKSFVFKNSVAKSSQIKSELQN